MKIQVTAEDIVVGRQRMGHAWDASQNCPIALAVKRATNAPKVRVSTQWIYGWGDAVNLPPHAMAFISRFDRGEAVEPFEFEFKYDPINCL